jgi:hypothetical protein
VELAEAGASSAFCIVVSARLPTYLYSGMPPRNAPKAVIIRLPNTASAQRSRSGVSSRGISSGAYWPSPCSRTTMSNPRSTANV